MTPAADFESWLSTATRRLALDGAERVRAEIGEHYQHTLASGATPGQAIAALGDPKAANRDYAQVFLTEVEASWIPLFPQQPKYGLRRKLIGLALISAYHAASYAAFNYFFPSFFTWTIVALLWLHEALRFFYPAYNQDRSLKYLVWSVVRIPFVLWFIRSMGGPAAGFVLPLSLLIYLNYKRWIIFRKLGGKPASPFVLRLLPGEPLLTRYEAHVLSDLTRRREIVNRILAIPFIALLALGAISAPLLFGALSAMFALRMILPCVVDLYTPARSRWFLKAKLTLLALAVILPPLPFLMPMIPGKPVPIPFVLIVMVLPFIVFFHTERPKIGLRRKLPVEEWPKELYL